jgi:hypothetical protein
MSILQLQKYVILNKTVDQNIIFLFLTYYTSFTKLEKLKKYISNYLT